MSDRPCLRALSERLGIYNDYWRIDGTHCPTGDPTREALLTAMGLDVTSEECARRELERREAAESARLFDTVRVVRSAEPRIHRIETEMHAASGNATRGRMRLALSTDETSVRGPCGTIIAETTLEREPGPEGDRLGAVFELSDGIEPGYYRLRCTDENGEPPGPDSVHATVSANEQLLILAPMRCFDPREATGGRQAFGVQANLYTARRSGDQGIGDLCTLARLARWTGSVGGDFVGINPLHTVDHRSAEPSPYFPLSRLFRSPGYIDLESVAELGGSGAAQRRLSSEKTRKELGRLRTSESIDYVGVNRLKLDVLALLHGEFCRLHGSGETERGIRYREYLARVGTALDDFAVYSALGEFFSETGRDDGTTAECDWHTWPEPYRDPASGAVSDFRDAQAERVDFFRYLQFVLSDQLGEAARAGRDAGLSIGLFQDLALGAAPGSADTWSFPEVFAQGATVGAPPDQFSPEGQNWALPPLVPSASRESGHAYSRALVRQALEHSGALRIDHAMGMTRQFWIAENLPASEGTYVAYPAHELLAVLTVESSRARAAIIAEDLGTVPEGFREQIADHGLLRTLVMYFEREPDGAFRDAADYPADALATVNTHDLPTLAGYWRARDIELREQGGLIDAETASHQRAERERDRSRLVDALDARIEAVEQAPAAVLTRATNAFLDRAPSSLAAVALDDLAGESEPVNVPGAPVAGRLNWARRMAVSVEEFALSEDVDHALAAFRSRKRKAASSQN